MVFCFDNTKVKKTFKKKQISDFLVYTVNGHKDVILLYMFVLLYFVLGLCILLLPCAFTLPLHYAK